VISFGGLDATPDPDAAGHMTNAETTVSPRPYDMTRPGREDLEETRMALLKACKTDDLKPGAALRLNTSPPLAVFRLDDGFYATEDTCSHAQSSLAAGEVDLDDCTVECPYHASQFEIKTGRVLSLPATKPIKTFPVKVVGDEVFVEV
jgi:3-phenylpropionate/trans-cinnamate dioxygenase ferredoxin subunit